MPDPLRLVGTDGVYVGGTADEFMLAWAQGRTNVALARKFGRVPYYCLGCDVADYPHWEMGRETDDDFDRRNEIEPPTDSTIDTIPNERSKR